MGRVNLGKLSQLPLRILLLVSLGVPLIGLVLLWIRPQKRVVWKISGSIVLLLLCLGYVHLLFGIRVELDGTGKRPIFSLHKPETHYGALGKRQSEHAFVSACSESVSEANYWTDFRAPQREGRYQEMKIRADWPSQGLPLLWRQPIGGGYASFAIADGLAFTIEQRRGKEVVVAYALETGREIWSHSWEAEFLETMGGNGPRSTPTWDEGRVYALGATGELHCLDAETGQAFWARNILRDNGAENLSWGMSASPLIVEEKVIVLPGGASGKSVVAYHKLSGKPVWKSLSDKQAYTSPMLISLAGRRQILVVSALRAMGLDPEDGSLLWEYPWTTQFDVNAAQPIILDENRFFISAGYGHGAALVKIAKVDGSLTARTVWANKRMKNKFNSSVLHQGHVYGLDEGILACLDVETGEQNWKWGRYGYGQVVLAGSHLIVLTEAGELVLVKATPEAHRELARFSAISGKTWNHPALAQGRLLVRNTTEMACFDLGVQ